MTGMRTQTPPKVWQEEFKIHSYEIGASGFASPQSICCFLQEAASNHADQLFVSAEEMARQDQMWVLSQLSVRMKRYPRWHDTIRIQTWPVSRNSSIRGYRDFVLLDRMNEEIGRASTLWLLLNTQNRRPLRIPSWLSALTSPAIQPDIIAGLGEANFNSENSDVKQEFTVRGSDIDWNKHVNNVCYLEWALEAIPAPLRLSQQVCELDISFVAEGKYGDTVIAECFKQEPDFTFNLHKITDKVSGNVLAMLRTRWEAKPSPEEN